MHVSLTQQHALSYCIATALLLAPQLVLACVFCVEIQACATAHCCAGPHVGVVEYDGAAQKAHNQPCCSGVTLPLKLERHARNVLSACTLFAKLPDGCMLHGLAGKVVTSGIRSLMWGVFWHVFWLCGLSFVGGGILATA